jgi:hypothetical protein
MVFEAQQAHVPFENNLRHHGGGTRLILTT